MNSDKIKTFMTLAGQTTTENYRIGSEKERELGAKLLLSEVLEYVIKGLGVIPSVNGVEITQPDNLDYKAKTAEPNQVEMIDGLADVAYTMYWNAVAFGVPLEEAFELVCDNNLEKFVGLQTNEHTTQSLDKEDWHLNKNISWPIEVTKVEIVKVNEKFYAVGKDASGKVRKPSSYKSVDLSALTQ